MKKQYLMTLAFILTGQAAVAQTPKITVLADPWCPYTCEAGSDKPGYMIEITKAALAGKYEVEYQVVAWARALSEVRAGKFNSVAGATDTDKEGLAFSPAMGAMQSCFYAKPTTNWKWDGTKSLESVSLGAVAGYTYEEALDKYIEDNKSKTERVQLVSGDNPLPQNIKKLEADRIKVIVEDKNVVEFYFSSQGKKNPFESKGCLPSSDLYVGFGQKNPLTKEVLKAMESGMKKIQANGEHKKILQKYGL